jgi:hypothetical protein
MTDDLDQRYPEVVYLLNAYVLGGPSLAGEMGDYTRAEGRQRAEAGLAALRRLVGDPAPDATLDAFARAHSSRYAGSGRDTLRRVADELAAALAAGTGNGTLADGPAAPASDYATAMAAGADHLTADAQAPAEVRERLTAWLVANDLIPPADYGGWDMADAGGGSWVLTPPGLGGVLFAVTPTTIRAIHPAQESVADALAELGL